MKENLKIFIDLDGVLANMFEALRKHFDITDTIEDIFIDSFTYFAEYGIEKEDIDSLKDNYNFWYNIPAHTWAKELIRLCRNYGDVYILSNPMGHQSCYNGKLHWCIDVLKINRKNIIITEAPKHLLASKNSVLIDDKESNITSFSEAGGCVLYWKHIVDIFSKNVHEKVYQNFNELENLFLELQS